MTPEDLAVRLAEVITVLDRLDIAAALLGIDMATPGWPSGGQGSTEDIALTKVEAVASIAIAGADDALTALAAFPRLCQSVLRASEVVSGLGTSFPVTQPARAVQLGTAMLREAQKRSQPLQHRTMQPLWNTAHQLRDETHRWASIAHPTNATPKEGAGIVSTDPKWCTSCARIPHTNEPRDGHHTRCRWCHSFHATYGQDAPVKLLERHLRGERIYQHQIDQAIARHPAKRLSA